MLNDPASPQHVPGARVVAAYKGGTPDNEISAEYIDKFTEIFKVAEIKTVTCMIMEVPCCSGLPTIIQKGMDAAGKKVPMEVVVISARGQIIGREKAA